MFQFELNSNSITKLLINKITGVTKTRSETAKRETPKTRNSDAKRSQKFSGPFRSLGARGPDFLTKTRNRRRETIDVGALLKTVGCNRNLVSCRTYRIHKEKADIRSRWVSCHNRKMEDCIRSLIGFLLS